MNYFMLIFLLLMTTPQMFGQARNTKSVLEFQNNSRKYLYNAKGWALNTDTRKWVENENFIYTEKLSFKPSIVYNNLDSLWFDKIVYKSDTLYGMFVYKLTGYYKYPAIRQDWQSVKELRYTLFYAKDYKELLDVLAQSSEKVYFIPTYHSGNITDQFDELSERRLLIEIEEKLDEEVPKIAELRKEWASSNKLKKEYENSFSKFEDARLYSFSKNYFPISSQEIEGKKIVRFEYIVDKYSMGNALMKKYFEVDHKEFVVLLIK